MIPHFKTYADVQNWLAPMGYATFMDTMLQIGLFGPEDRAHCDQTLQEGIADMQTVCSVMKFIAGASIQEQLDLPLQDEVLARIDRPDLRPVA